MNYCTKCASLYAQPGTCNCYASAKPLAPVQPYTPVMPTVAPYPPSHPSPWWGVQPPVQPAPSWTPTITTTVTEGAVWYTVAPFAGPHHVYASGVKTGGAFTS